MPSSSLVEVEVEVGVEVEVDFETTFSVGGWLGGRVAGKNGIKAISSSKFKLKMSLAIPP